MIGQTQSPVADLEARIRQEVGKFLTNKATLLKLQRSKDINVQNKARELYKRQVAMEPELDKVMKVIDDAKKGVWTLGSLANAGLFARDLYFHNRAVEQLAIGQPLTEAGIGTMLSNPIVLIVGLSVIGYFVTRRR